MLFMVVSFRIVWGNSLLHIGKTWPILDVVILVRIRNFNWLKLAVVALVIALRVSACQLKNDLFDELCIGLATHNVSESSGQGATKMFDINLAFSCTKR